MGIEDSPKNPYIVTYDSMGKAIVKSVLFGLLSVSVLVAIASLLIYPKMEVGKDVGSYHFFWVLNRASLPCIGLFATMSASMFLTKSSNCHFAAALVKTAIGTTASCIVGISLTLAPYHKLEGRAKGDLIAMAVLLIAPWGIAFILLGAHKFSRSKPEHFDDIGPDVN